MYELHVDRRALKQIEKLHLHDKQAVIKVLDQLPQIFSSPQRSPHRTKLKAEENAWRYRQGDVRILFYQNKKQKRLEVYKIDYRGGVYG